MLDQSKDVNGQLLHRIISLYPPPDFVKQASMEAIRGEPGLHKHHFADQANQMYPVHTGAATWVSAACFYENYGQHDPKEATVIETTLQKMARYHGVLPQVNDVKVAVLKTAAKAESELSDEEFMFIWKSDDGAETLRHYPLRNRREIKEAAAYLTNYRHEFNYPLRQKMARRLLAKASQYEVELDPAVLPHVEKIAGFGFAPGKDVCKAMMHRAAMIQKTAPHVAEQLKEAAAKLLQATDFVRRPKVLEKVAAQLDAVDRAYGLGRYYGDLLDAPEEVCFQILPADLKKTAAALVQTTTGNVYSKEALDKLDIRQIQDGLGTEIAESVSSAGGLILDQEKLAQILPTLPRGDAAIFDQLAEAAGVTPLAKTAGSSQKMTKAELFELAQLAN